jgi:preprotein translocase subunit YajC
LEFLPLALIALLFWFLIIRPQRRRAAAQTQLQNALEPGQEVMTASGLYGRIESIEEDVIRLEIAPGTTVRVDRRAVANRIAEQADSGGSPVP